MNGLNLRVQANSAFSLFLFTVFIINWASTDETCKKYTFEGKDLILEHNIDMGQTTVPKVTSIEWWISPVTQKDILNTTKLKEWEEMNANASSKDTARSLCVCDISGSDSNCGRCNEEDIVVSVEKTVDDNITRVNLTVSRVNRTIHNGFFLLFVNGELEQECSVQVYALQSTPTCSFPKTGIDQKDLHLDCKLRNVFPKPSCSFLWGRVEDSQDLDEVFQLTSYTKTISKGPWDITYIETGCAGTVSFQQMTAGYKFVFNMVFTFQLDNGAKRSIGKPIALVFGKPQASISKSCPKGQQVNQGYIKEGTSATCECQTQPDAFPPEVAHWKADDTLNVSISGGPYTSVLSLAYEPTLSSHQFTCSGSSVFGKDSGKETYTPKFAYGPKQVLTKLISSPVYDICPGNLNSVSLVCSVPKSGAKPKPAVIVQMEGYYNISHIFEKSVGGMDEYHFAFQPSHGGGNLTLRCLAYNPIFEDLNAHDDVTITAMEPPSKPTIMFTAVDPVTSVGKSVVSVKDGSTLRVRCLVKGGYPLASRVNLTCAGSQGVRSQSNQADVALTVTEVNDGDTCTCVAWHELDCFDQRSTRVRLDVQYGAKVSQYSIKSELIKLTDGTSSQVVVESGTKLQFVCEGSGNPRPEVTLASTSALSFTSSKTLHTGIHSRSRVSSIDSVQCGDSGFYTCTASNELKTESKRLLLLVKCAPKLPNEDLNTAVLIAYPGTGSNVNVSFRLTGYPEPTQHDLRHAPSNVAADATTSAAKDGLTKVDSGKYRISQQQIVDEFHWLIELELLALKESDTGMYHLVMGNGVGRGTAYKFYINSLGGGGGGSSVLEGDDCTAFTDKIYFFFGGTSGGLILLIILVSVCACVCARKRNTTRFDVYGDKARDNTLDIELHDVTAFHRNESQQQAGKRYHTLNLDHQIEAQEPPLKPCSTLKLAQQGGTPQQSSKRYHTLRLGSNQPPSPDESGQPYYMLDANATPSPILERRGLSQKISETSFQDKSSHAGFLYSMADVESYEEINVAPLPEPYDEGNDGDGDVYLNSGLDNNCNAMTHGQGSLPRSDLGDSYFAVDDNKQLVDNSDKDGFPASAPPFAAEQDAEDGLVYEQDFDDELVYEEDGQDNLVYEDVTR